MKKTAIIIAVLAVSVSVLFGVASGSYDDEFQKAVQQYKEGSYEEAARTLERYVKERPEGRAYYLLGYANYALGKHDEAARNFEDAYLVAPEMSPKEFRKSIGIDTGIPSRPKVKKPAPAAPAVEAPAPVPAVEAPAPAPAVEAPAEAPPPPAEEAPAPRPSPTPMPAEPFGPEAMAALGLIPLVIALAVYLFYCLSVFMVGRKTDTGASWLAFVPGVNFVWPLVGAANKSKVWILLTLFIPFVSLYLWMLVAERFGKSKVLGLLFGLIVGVPVLNILFVKLVFKEAGAAKSVAAMGFDLPEIPDEMPELPSVPGMEEVGEEPFEAGAAPEEDIFGGGFGEEEAPAEEPAEDDFGGLLEEAEETPAEEAAAEDIFGEAEEEPAEDFGFDLGEEEEEGERAPTLQEMGFGEEGEEAPAEEAFDFGEEEAAPEDFFADAEEDAPIEEAFEEELTPLEETFEEAPAEEAFDFGEEGAPAEDIFGEAEEESLETITPQKATEKAAPHKGAEAWEFPEEEPLEYEPAEEEEELEGELPALAGAGLMGIGELFTKTFGVFKKRVLLLLGLYLFAVLVTGVAVGVFVGIGALLSTMLEGMKTGIVIGTGVVAAIAGTIAFAWAYGAFVFAVAEEGLGFGEALKRSWQKVGTFIGVFLLTNIVIVGGFGLFLIPGILFVVWFSFTLFVFAKEGVSGMSALLKSKEYVKGNFGAVFLRLLLIIILSGVVGAVPFVGPILSLLYAPFMMLFMYNIYADLRGLKGKFSFAPSGGQKALWLVLGILGWIVAPIIFFALAGAAFIAPLLMNVQQF